MISMQGAKVKAVGVRESRAETYLRTTMALALVGTTVMLGGCNKEATTPEEQQARQDKAWAEIDAAVYGKERGPSERFQHIQLQYDQLKKGILPRADDVSTIFSLAEFSDASSILIKTKEGRDLLVNTKDSKGMTALDAALVTRVSLAVELTKTPEGRDLLINTKEPGGGNVLDIALFSHQDFALILIETQQGREFLAGTYDAQGENALEAAVAGHDSVPLELIKTPEGRALLADTKASGGYKVLHRAVRHYETVSLELIKTPEGRALLADTKDSRGMSALEEAVSGHPDVAAELERVSPDTAKKLLRK